jgi:hypothetical protein
MICPGHYCVSLLMAQIFDVRIRSALDAWTFFTLIGYKQSSVSNNLKSTLGIYSIGKECKLVT